MASFNDILRGVSVGKRDGEDDIYAKPDNSPSPSSAEAEGLNKNNTNTDGGKTGVQSAAQTQVINKTPEIDKTPVTVDSPATNLAPVEDDGGDALEHGERVDAGSGSSSESVADNRGEQMGFYEKFLRENNPYRVETDEEREKREKKEKREGVISGIGNALSAFANLYFATKGAPSINPEVFEKMSAQNRERWERLARERKENERAWYEALMRAKRQDYEDAWREKQYQHTLEREKKSDELAAKKEEREALLAELNAKKRELEIIGQTDKNKAQELKNDILEIEKRYANTYYRNKANTKGSKTGGGKTKKYYGSLPDKDGNMIPYETQADYDRELNAPWRNIDPNKEVVTVTEKQDALGTNKETKKTQKAKTRGEKAGETMGNTGKGNKWSNASTIKYK